MRAIVRPEGVLQLERRIVRVALGRGGITRHKEEGDGATPAGVLPLRRVLYRADRMPRPKTALPAEPIAAEDGWCDDPRDRAYNTQIRLPHEAHHEALWRRDPLYDLIGVLGWNDSPIERGRGSAIFLHVARPDFAPTEGCIALSLADLGAVLADGLQEVEVLGARK